MLPIHNYTSMLLAAGEDHSSRNWGRDLTNYNRDPGFKANVTLARNLSVI